MDQQHITRTAGFRNLLAFVILMGNSQVLSKSPDYIVEKFDRYCSPQALAIAFPDERWQWGLDSDNRGIYMEYMRTWGPEEDKHLWEPLGIEDVESA
jgi:hypothetical protein